MNTKRYSYMEENVNQTEKKMAENEKQNQTGKEVAENATGTDRNDPGTDLHSRWQSGKKRVSGIKKRSRRQRRRKRS